MLCNYWELLQSENLEMILFHHRIGEVKKELQSILHNVNKYFASLMSVTQNCICLVGNGYQIP